jgi:hypothetical protein
MGATRLKQEQRGADDESEGELEIRGQDERCDQADQSRADRATELDHQVETRQIPR